jgi:hypothetical protein
MAAGEKIVRTLAAVTGALPATIDRATREAQKAGLAPIGRKGGGKGAAHWNHHHLVNAAIIAALATVGVPMTSARETVPLFRALGTVPTDDQAAYQAAGISQAVADNMRAWLVEAGIVESGKSAEANLPEQTLGEVLDNLVDACGRPDGEALRQLLRDGACRITLGFIGRTPWARLSLHDRPTGRIYSTEFLPQQLAFLELHVPVPGLHGAFRPAVTITAPLLEALADLWADTIAHESASAGSERKSEAPT